MSQKVAQLRRGRKPAGWDEKRKKGEEGKGEEPREERRKRRRCREEVAKARNYSNLRTTQEWVAEFAYQPTVCTESYRMIVVRKKIEHTKGQLFLFEEYRYRFVITNIPWWSPAGVVAHGRRGSAFT